jgi:hypothetical protein
LFARRDAHPTVTVRVAFDENEITVEDNAAGITFEADHKSGGFSLTLKVQAWARDDTVPWTVPISKRSPKANNTGTRIVLRELHDEIKRRILDGNFEGELIEKLSKVYSFFLGRVVEMSVNGKTVKATQFVIGRNFSHDKFHVRDVDCTITAGIASAAGDKFVGEAAGWFVFCNFRTVIYGDKTPLTGWGSTLPLFQPKHRPFLGLVLFTSANPESLPWTTTKRSVNEDDVIWQEAKVRMVAVAKPVLRFLDSRYPTEGVDVDPKRIAELSGRASNVFDAAVSQRRAFTAPPKEPPKETKVQYYAKRSELERVRRHFGRSNNNMSASEVGRQTFEFFLRNEVSGR